MTKIFLYPLAALSFFWIDAGLALECAEETTNLPAGWYDPNPDFSECVQVNVTNPNAVKVKKRSVMRSDPSGDSVLIEMIYGTEKQDWLQECKQRFMDYQASLGGKFTFTVESVDATTGVRSQSQVRRHIDVKLTGEGSVKSADLVYEGNSYDLWSPASSQVAPIALDYIEGLKAAEYPSLVASPMVFLTHEIIFDNFEKFVFSKGKTSLEKRLSWNGLIEATYEYGVDQGEELVPDADYLLFGFTDPLKSNSGFVGLVTMYYEYLQVAGKTREARQDIDYDILGSRRFQSFLSDIKHQNNSEQSSTARLTEDFTSSDGGINTNLAVIWTYESDAIQKIDARRSQMLEVSKRPLETYTGDKQAIVPEGESYRVMYPRYNAVSNHPLYVLTHGNSNLEVAASKLFAEFLMQEDQQRLALKYGFRPGLDSFPIAEIARQFSQYSRNGVVLDFRSKDQTGGSFDVRRQSGETVEALRRVWRGL